MFLWNWLKHFGTLIKGGLEYAHQRGLDDKAVDLAIRWARIAAEKFVDHADRREFVVKMLTMRGMKESVARLAVEIAVQLIKSEEDDGSASS